MIILSSPSGAGKTTLVKLLSKNKNFHISISHTTRKPRPNEVSDKDYYFVNHDKFEGLIKNEEFLEYAKVFNHFYGTTRSPVIEKLEKSENIAFTAIFNKLIRKHDQQALVDYWQKLTKKIKQREAVLFAYCRILAENGIVAPLEKLLLPTLKKEASDNFIKQLTELPLAKATNQTEIFIAAVQKHLHVNQHSIKWLTCLGHLALAAGQWQMSEKAFHSLFTVEGYLTNNDDLKACALALSKQSKYHQANELLQQILN